MIKRHLQFIGIGSLYVATGVFILMTDPQRLSPILLFVPFLLFFLALWLTILAVMRLLAAGREAGLNRKGVLLAMVAAGLPVLLLLLGSVGQLALRDIVTIVLLVGLLVFYIVRTDLAT